LKSQFGCDYYKKYLKGGNMNKNAKANFSELFALGVVLLAVILLAPAATQWGNNLFATGGKVDGTSAPTQKIEVVTEKACGSTTLTMDFSEKYSSSTDVTAQNGTVYINGGRKGLTSEGSTLTVQGKDKLNVYYALDPAQRTYYASHASGEIPCTGQTASFMTSAILGKGNLAGELQNPPHEIYRADTGMAVTTINDDNTQNIGTSTTGRNQSIGTGQTVQVEVRLKPTFERGYGVASGNTLACQFNDTAYDQAKSEVALDGTVLAQSEFNPTNTLFPLVDTSRTIKSWKVPPIDGKIKSRYDLIFTIKGDDTNQPANGGKMGNEVNGADWNCTLFDTDLNETDDNAVKVDVEDRDDNTNVGVIDFAFHIGIN